MKGKISKKIAVILTLALIFGFGSAAWAASVTPVVVPDNPVCECGDYSYKIDENPENRTYLDGEFPNSADPSDPTVEIVIKNNDGIIFDWEVNRPVCAVIVKGGPDGNVYSYSPPAFGDTGLQPPINPSTGQPYGISHVTFCYYEPVPAIDIEKHTCGEDADDPTGPKIVVGADVPWTYYVKIDTIAGGNVPLSNVVVEDSDLGVISGPASGDDGDGVLELGEIWEYVATGTAVAGQYANTGTATGEFGGDTVDDSDPSHYFGVVAEIDIVKIIDCANGDGLPLTLLPGNEITWQYTVTNTGEVPLSDVVVTDSDLGVIAGPASGDTNSDGKLDLSETWIYEAAGTSGEVDYVNEGTATGKYTDDCGYSDDVSATDGSSYSIAAPSFTVSKVCGSSPVPQEGPAVFEVVFENTGDVDLSITANEGIGTFDLAVGGTLTSTVIIPGPFITDPPTETVDNTVEATATYIDDCGNQWLDTKSAEATCGVAGRVNVLKLTQGQVDPGRDWEFKIYEVGVAGEPLGSDSTFNDDDGILDFGGLNLDPAKTYILMEVMIPSGWTSIWQVFMDMDSDGVPDTFVYVTPYNPDLPADLGNRAIDIGFGTSFPIPAGDTLIVEVDNTYPGGDARTPGYWKNWNTVTGGGQAANAERNGGSDEGFWLLDDVLNIGNGITIGTLLLTGNNLGEAVSILDQRDISSGKKMAKDAAYTLAMHLLAYECNRTAGAYISSLASGAAIEAQALLAGIGFDGTGRYLSSKDPLYEIALGLAEILDSYNNNELQ